MTQPTFMCIKSVHQHYIWDTLLMHFKKYTQNKTSVRYLYLIEEVKIIPQAKNDWSFIAWKVNERKKAMMHVNSFYFQNEKSVASIKLNAWSIRAIAYFY